MSYFTGSMKNALFPKIKYYKVTTENLNLLYYIDLRDIISYKNSNSPDMYKKDDDY